jgi:hypothetical protein
LLAPELVDLPAARLGGVAGGRVSLDRNAAGWGWFVDPTPDLDEEFEPPSPETGERRARPGGPADGRMDLLTALMHELGHARGEAHSDSSHADSLMAPKLAVGVRRGPVPGRPAPSLVQPGTDPADSGTMAGDTSRGNPAAPPGAALSPERRKHRSVRRAPDR